MKVVVIGYGKVGMAVFTSLMNMPEITELALCGRNTQKIKGEVLDFRDLQALDPTIKTKISGGGYEVCKGADIIIYAAGAAVHNSSQSRNDIAEENIAIIRSISEEIVKYNKDAVIIAISNPLDMTVSALVKYTGRPREKVIGTGTLLDTARLKRTLADILEIRPENIDAYVLGEHGSSCCIMWSFTRILGMDIQDFLNAEIEGNLSVKREKLREEVVRIGYDIFSLKGSTSYGVATAAAKIVSAIIHDTHEIMPVSVKLEGEFGIDDIAMSVPCYVSARGAEPITNAVMTEEEEKALNESAAVIREITERFV